MAHPGAGFGGGVGRLRRRVALNLLPQGTSSRRWSQRLTAAATDAVRVREFGFWSAMLSAPSLSLLDGALDEDRDVAGSAGHLTMTLPGSVTDGIADPGSGGVSCRDQRGGADRLAGRWCNGAGGGGSRASSNAVLIDVERHGREEIFADV